MTKETPIYRVTHERGYFNGAELVPFGTEIEHDGVPGDHLEPVNDAAKKAVETQQKKGEGTSAPGKNFLAADPNGGGGGGGGSDNKDSEIARLKAELAQAQGKLSKFEGEADAVVHPYVEPASVGLVRPQDVDSPSHTGAYMADVEAEAEAEGAQPEAAKRGPGRPRKS